MRVKPCGGSSPLLGTMTERILQCPHLGLISSASIVQGLVEAGRLQDSRGKGLICEWRIPMSSTSVNGQDVACVGPQDSNCPDPASASFISIEDIK